MKKAPTSQSPDSQQDELLPEYNFDYCKARPNRFANQFDRDQLVVVPDPDIAKVFTTSESVNAVLRALIVTMPEVPQEQ